MMNIGLVLWPIKIERRKSNGVKGVSMSEDGLGCSRSAFKASA
jgi:hypothetical protein